MSSGAATEYHADYQKHTRNARRVGRFDAFHTGLHAMRSSLRSTLLLAVGILLTLGVLIASETGNVRLSQGYRQVIQSQQAETAINELLAELVNAEAGQRGFLLTGKDEYLDPYNKAIPHIHALMAEIRDHYANDPDALKLFSETALQVSRKLTEMELTLIYGKRDLEVALDLVRTDFGKASMEAVRQGLDRLRQREIATVARSLEHAERDLALSRYGIALITAVNIILLVVLGMQHAKRLAVTELARDKAEEESQKLDRMVRERTRQLSDLAAHLQRVTEDEKTRLARELHDELGAILTATKMDLHWLRSRMQANEPAVSEKITRVMAHVDQGIQIKRRLIEDLRPTILLNLGLVEALSQLTEDVGVRNGWHTEVSLPDDMPKLTDDAAIALYRIVQESLTNASKYAHATSVSVALDVNEDEGVRLRVRDNGRGFPADIERRRMVGHHGLLGMEQRAIALGGTLTIDSMPGGGVTIIVELPPTDAVFERVDHTEHARPQTALPGGAAV